MPTYYKPSTDHPLLYQLKKNRLSKIDACKVLQITKETYNRYIDNPDLMRWGHLRLLASMFRMEVPELMYLIERAKPQIDHYKYKADKWYLQDQLNSIEQKYNSDKLTE